MANQFIDVYGKQAEDAFRADQAKRASINSAIGHVTDIANVIFKFAQMRQKAQQDAAELATNEDLRKHNALTLTLGTLGQQGLGQSGLQEYENNWQKVTGNPQFRLPRNPDTGLIEIPADQEQQLHNLFVDKNLQLSDIGQKMWAATQTKPGPDQQAVDDYKAVVQKYGPNSANPDPVAVDTAWNILHKRAQESLSQGQAQTWSTLTPQEQHDAIMKAGSTNVAINLPSTERKDIIDTETNRRDVNAIILGLDKFKQKYGDVFGRFSGPGSWFKLQQFFQTPGSEEKRAEFNRLNSQIGFTQAAQVKQLQGTAQSPGEKADAEKFKIVDSDDMATRVGKLLGARDMIDRRAAVQHEAAKGTKGEPTFSSTTTSDSTTTNSIMDNPNVRDAFRYLGSLGGKK